MTQPPATASSPRCAAATVLSAAARAVIIRAIEDNDGGEVFFVGRAGPDRIADDVLPCAFGNQDAVPALTSLAEAGDVVIHNHPSGGLQPSHQDIEIASALGERSVGFYIIDNACENAFVVTPAFEAPAPAVLDPDRMDELLGREGFLARAMDNYEFRPEQINMARAVCRAFNEDAVCVIEAGTGTGKSMAYLLPAVLWALENKEKVVVSTNTINLQEQLIHKDLPMLARRLGPKFRAELLKGRGNYLCLRRLEEVREHGQDLLGSGFANELKELMSWAKATPDGSLSDLAFRPATELWDEIKSEADNCPRTRCARYRDCFYYNARRRASAANILVANHALLLTDLALRLTTGNYTEAAVLPPFHRLVLDEGHNIEEAATRAFSAQVTVTGLRRMCRRWANPERRGMGVLSAFIRRLREAVEAEADWPVLEAAQAIVYEHLQPGSEELATVASEVCERMLPPLMDSAREESGAFADPARITQLRITGEVAASPLWLEHIEPLTRQMHAAISHFTAQADRLSVELKKLSKSAREKIASAALQVESHAGRMRLAGEQIGQFLKRDDNLCVWLEYAAPRRPGDPPILRWLTAPIEVGSVLKAALFAPVKTTIVTSATLTVDRKFDYVLTRLGLRSRERPPAESAATDDEPAPAYLDEDAAWDPDAPDFAPDRAPRPAENLMAARPKSAGIERPVILEVFDSPFNYREQALIAAPRDMPDPRRPEYESAVADAIERAVRISRGGAFVLFTSYGMLNRTVTRVGDRLSRERFTVLRQGDLARHALLERFRSSPRAVLFATSSFWEGVDVQGDALVLLVLARLPFSVPSEPVQQARVEAIERRGGNSFTEFSVPSAVIRFKQGFGRLIRSRTDRGAVLILDSRVVRQFYGRAFLNSLPAHDIWKGLQAQLWPELERFFAYRAR